MKILVTGGCGFIGLNLVNKLKQKNFEVIVLDKVINYDIRDYKKTRPMYDNVDYVFHLAAEISIPKSLENPEETFDVNINGTNTVLRCSTEAGVKRVIFSSTSSVYGNSSGINVETQKEQCLNPYSISKLAGEQLCRSYGYIYELETVILRYFNVFGNGQSDSGTYAPVVSKFLKQKNNNEPLTIFGNGNQIRDFIHVDDVVNTNISAMKNNKKFFAEIFNVGTGIGISIKQLADIISDNKIFLPQKQGEILISVSNNTKLKNVLNYNPEKNILDWLNEV